VSDPYQNYPQDPNYQPTQADTGGYQPQDQQYYQQPQQPQQPYQDPQTYQDPQAYQQPGYPQQPQQPYQQYQQPYAQPGFPQPVSAPGQPMQPGQMGQPAKRKFPVGVIIAVVAVIVLCCGGGTIFGIVEYNSHKNDNKTGGSTATGGGGGAVAGGGGTTGTGGASPNGGGTSTPGGGDNTQDLKMGDSVTVTDEDGSTMSVTVSSVKYRTTGCDTGEFNLSDPQKGDAYVVIDVTYNVTSGKGSYNPFDWSVVDSDGNQSSEVSVFADCKPELGSSNSLHGKRHGLVVVEVKTGVEHGQVIYSTPLGDDSASWDF
jgi:hypothetical protein